MNSIGDFFARLGFVIEDNELPKLQEDIKSVQDTALAMGAALAAAAVALGIFTGAVAANLGELGDFSEREQVAIEVIQELGHAAQLSGSSLEAVRGSIQGVNKAIGEAALGFPRGVKLFEKLGLSAKNSDGSVKSFDQLLANVGDKMKGLSRQEQISMAEKLGIDRSLVVLLSKGSAGIAELREEARKLGVATQADADAAGAFNSEMDRLKFTLLGLGRTIAVQVMPHITGVLKGMRDWYERNRDFIRLGIERVLAVMSAFLSTASEWLGRLTRSTSDAIKWLMQFNVVVWASVAALTAFVAVQTGAAFTGLIAQARALMTWLSAINLRLLLVTGVIGIVVAAVVLLADEIANFVEGGDSFLGDLVKEFPVLVVWFNALMSAAKKVGAYLMGLYTTLRPSLDRLGQSLIKLFTAMGPAASILGALFMKLLPVIEWVLTRLLGGLSDFITAAAIVIEILTDLLARLIDVVAEIVDFITFLFKAGTDDWLNGFKALADGIRGVFSTLADWLESKFGFMGGLLDKARVLLGLRPRDTPTSPTLASLAQAGGAAPALLGPRVASAVAALPDFRTPAVPSLLEAIQAAPAAGRVNAPAPRPAGVLGRAEGAGSNTSTTTANNTTTVNAPIYVTNPDPVAAGREVRRSLEDVQRQAIRNGQSKVDI